MPKYFVQFIEVLIVWSLTGPVGWTDKPPKKTRVDQFGDPLPDAAVARLSTTRWRLHESQLTFATNGRYAIVAGKPADGDEATRLLDTTTGNILRVFSTPSWRAFFIPNTTTVMLGHGEKIRYLDVETGKISREIALNGFAKTWSIDGKRVVCKPKPWIYSVWDLDKGVELFQCQKQNGDCALSADGALLAVRTLRDIHVFSVGDKKVMSEWKSQEPSAGRTGNAQVVLFLRDNKTLIAAESQRVLMWDVATGQLKPKGKLVPVLETAHDDAVTLAASADGRYLAAGGSKGTVYIWDLKADRLLHTLRDAGRGLPIYTLNFTPDAKRLISQAHLFPSARVWEVASGKELTSTAVASSNIDKMAFSPDGTMLATTGRMDPVQLWDATTGKLLRKLERGDSFAFTPSGKALTTMRYPDAAIWNLPDATLRHRLKGESPRVAPGKDDKVLVWTSCCPTDDSIIAIFSGDVRRVIPARGKDGIERKIYWTMVGSANAQTGKIQQSFRVETAYLNQVCLSPDRKILAASGQLPDRAGNIASIFVFDLQRGVELFHADLPKSHYCESLTFSTDSRMVFLTSCISLSTNVNMFQIYEVPSGKQRASFQFDLDPKVAWSRGAIASDKLAAITKGTIISLFNPATGKEVGRLQTNQDKIRCLAFSPDGSRLACAGDDSTALIWDITNLVLC